MQLQQLLHSLLLLHLQKQKQQQGHMAWGIHWGSKPAEGYLATPEMAIRLFQEWPPKGH
jgi:hypothetical protein